MASMIFTHRDNPKLLSDYVLTIFRSSYGSGIMNLYVKQNLRQNIAIDTIIGKDFIIIDRIL
jgi:hypothetical protein